ncbi:hypothetical protein [Xanthobacter autotrophicus]|uniref:hypothetical protein n=1 Tax=Xanthobacter autotrophicus TaxID=280 RepID=UPI00372BD572
MNTKDLETIAARVASWPEAAREEAVWALLAIEERHQLPAVLDEATRRAVREGLAQAKAGNFASQAEVGAVFRKR